MSNKMTTIHKTDFLKGVAIISVLINHYINNYISIRFSEIANGMVSIFFLLSGYGLFYSLSRKKSNIILFYKGFYLKRILRIYPLYIVSLLLSVLFAGNSFSLFTYIAFPFQASGIYWFITSLIQCYFLSPLIFAVWQKFGNRNYILFLTIILFVTQLVSLFLKFEPTRQYFGYRFMAVGHLFLFSYGICIPKLQLPKFLTKSCFIAASGFIFLTTLLLTRQRDFGFENSGLYFSSLFILSCFIFISSILKKQDLNLKFYIISFLGKHSYSIYLFHLFYFGILYKLGLIQKQSLIGIIVTLICFPFFLIGCIFAEKISSIKHWPPLSILGRPTIER